MKKRRIHDYISKDEAKILEKIYAEWKPSRGHEELFTLINSLKSDTARIVAWTHYAYLSSWLMDEV